MGKLKDLTGKKFGRLTVLEYVGRKSGKTLWLCKCDCGNKITAIGGNLTRKTKPRKSCGCYQKEAHLKSITKHGFATSKKSAGYYIYNTWCNMQDRCSKPNETNYDRYGGRGISVCSEWNHPRVFVEWAKENGWKKGLQIDRIDNNGNYEPDNCHFVTSAENCQNRSSTKLNAEKVRKIRELYETGKKNVNELLAMFDVCGGTIYSIINYKSWRNIESI